MLLALAYAQAPNPAEYLGFSSPSARPLTRGEAAPTQPGAGFTAAQAPALAATQLEPHTGPTQ